MNYNPTGYTIRVPGVPNGYPGLSTTTRFIRPQHFNFMAQNGMVQGVHHNINGYNVPNVLNLNPRLVNPMMRMPMYKPNSIGRLLSFVETLGGDVTMNNNLQDIQHWKRLTQTFFTEDAIMRYTLYDGQNDKSRTFGFTYHVIPRFYQTFIESGVIKIQLILGSPTEKIIGNQNSYQCKVECPSASIEYHFDNGIQVSASCSLAVLFVNVNNTLKMTNFELVTKKFTEYVPRNLIRTFTGTVVVNEYGIPNKTMRCLELAEVVDDMQDVIALTIKDSHTGPLQALRMIMLHSHPTPTMSNDPNPNQRMQNHHQLNGMDIKNETYNGAPPTPNTSDLQASASTPASTPTPVPTPTPTPSLTPSPLVSANGISSPLKFSKSPALSEQGLQGLKRVSENGSVQKQKRRSIQNKTK